MAAEKEKPRRPRPAEALAKAFVMKEKKD